MSLANDPVPGAIRVPASFEEVRKLADWLRTKCREAGLSEMTVAELELATVEAANNLVQHGYERPEAGEIGLDLLIDKDAAIVILGDRGRPLASQVFEDCRPVSPEMTEGRGAWIVRSCVDGIAYRSRNGVNILTLTKLL